MKAIRLGNVVDIVMGQAPPGNACNKDGVGVPFVKAGEFQYRRPVIREWTTKPLKMAQHDDTLVCVVGATAGKVNQGADCAIGRSVAAVRPQPGAIDPEYLYRFLSTTVARLRGGSQGAAQGVITREMIGNLELELPALPEQRRIAAILDHADTLRAKRRQVLTYLDAMAQSIFNDMFGDHPLDTLLGDVSKRITDGTHQPPPWTGSGIPFLFVSNITSGEIDLQTQKFISLETWAQLTRRTPIEVGDVLYSTVGSFGIPAVVRTDERFAFQRHIAHIKPDPGALNSDFLAAQLAGQLVKRQAVRAARGIAQPTVNLADIKKFSIAVPPLAEQERFGARTNRVRATKFVVQHVATSQDELFASLQRRAFRGEL